MTRSVLLVGGPLCGKRKPLSKAAPDFVFAHASGDRADSTVRLFQASSTDRWLYRKESVQQHATHRTEVFLYAGHQYARCCGAFHRRSDDGNLACTLCGNKLLAER